MLWLRMRRNLMISLTKSSHLPKLKRQFSSYGRVSKLARWCSSFRYSSRQLRN